MPSPDGAPNPNAVEVDPEAVISSLMSQIAMKSREVAERDGVIAKFGQEINVLRAQIDQLAKSAETKE